MNVVCHEQTTPNQVSQIMNAKFYELFFAIFLMVSGYGLMAYIIVRFFMNKARLERSREEIPQEESHDHDLNQYIPQKSCGSKSPWFNGGGLTPQTKGWRRERN